MRKKTTNNTLDAILQNEMNSTILNSQKHGPKLNLRTKSSGLLFPRELKKV